MPRTYVIAMEILPSASLTSNKQWYRNVAEARTYNKAGKTLRTRTPGKGPVHFGVGTRYTFCTETQRCYVATISVNAATRSKWVGCA